MNRSLSVICVTLLLTVSSSFARGEFDRTSPYKGMYAIASFNPVIGIKTIKTIKIRLSFRYMINDGVDFDFFFGFTLRSFWAIDQGSHPFKELVFNPEAWFQWSARDVEDTEWRLGIEHESNGLAGSDSRGWNKIYVEGSDGWLSGSGDWSSRYAVKLWRAFMVSGSTGHMVKNQGVIGNYGYDATADLVEEGNTSVPGQFAGFLRIKRWPLPTRKMPGFLELDLQTREQNILGHLQIFRGHGERLIPQNSYRRFKPKLGVALLQ